MKIRKSRLVVFSSLMLLVLGLGMQGLRGTATETETVPAQVTLLGKEKNAENPEDQIQDMVTGFWQSEYYGTRHLTIQADGTATIYYEPSLLAQFVVGKQLTIHYDWKYDPEQKQVVFTVTSGFPAKSFEYVLKKWGKTQRQTVIEASKDELLLLDTDGETKHHWHRIAAIDEEIIKKFQEP